MKPASSFRSTCSSTLLAIGLAATAFTCAAHADEMSPQAKYEKQRAACLAGKSNEDQATCLKEAGAALEENKRGQLNDGDSNYRKNQMDRCKALSGDEKKDCFARMKGSGTVSGSVGGGGIIREKTTTTVTVGPAVPASAPN